LLMRKTIKKAALELILIFAGISLALGLENWIASVQLANQEKQLLSEMLSDLEETQLDLLDDMRVLQDITAYMETLIDHLNVASSGSDLNIATELSEDLKNIALECETRNFVVPKTAAYTSIQSLGLDLIKNDSLRTAITNFYELAVTRIATTERTVQDIASAECWSYINDHFSWLGPINVETFTTQLGTYRNVSINNLAPREGNIDRFLQDDSFRTLVSRLLFRRSIVLRNYRNANDEIEELKSAIEGEIS